MLVQGVRDYAIYMLDTEGRVTNWNSGAQSIKGYTADEIVGQHFSRFYTDEDEARGEPQFALETALREGKYEREAWRVRKDGSPFWASVVLDPIFDEIRQACRLRQDHPRHHRAEKGAGATRGGAGFPRSSRRSFRRSAS